MKNSKHNWSQIAAVSLLGAVFLTAIGLLLFSWLGDRTNKPVAVSSDLPTQIEKTQIDQRTLIVGGDDSYPPYSYLENGIAEGFNNDLIRAIASAMGMKVEFNLTSWEEARQNLLRGKVDVINGMFFTFDQEEFFDFTNPHSVRYFDLFVRTNSAIHSFKDLQTASVVVEQDSIMQDYLQSTDFSGTQIFAANPDQAIKWISSGEYDGALLDKIIGYYYIDQDRLSNLRSLNLNLIEQNYGFAVKKGNSQLVQKLNDALTEVNSSGVYEQLSQKWFSAYRRVTLLDQLRYFIYGFVALISLFGLVLLWGWSLRKLVSRRTNELRKSEEKYRQLIDSATEGVYVLREGKLVYLNPEAIEILGINGQPDFPVNFSEFIHPDEFQKLEEYFQKCKLSGSDAVKIEFRLVRADGEVRWIKANTRIIDWQSEPAQLGIFSDITEARELAESVKKSETRFRLLFNKTPVGLFYYDFNLVITNSNDLFTKILKIPKDNLERFDLHQIHDKRILPAIDAVLNQDEGYYEGAYNPLTEDSRGELYISLHTTPIFSENHEVLGGIGVVENITDIVESETKLHNLEDRFTKTFLTSPDSININRLKDGLYYDINPGFTELTGYTREEVIGKTSLEINIWSNAEDRARLVKELQTKGEVKNLEAPFRLKDGSVKIGLMSAAVIDLDGEICIISITRDISNRKKAEDAIRASEFRYRTIFQTVPVSIWEEDFLKIYDMLEERRSSGIKDLKSYLKTHPEFTRAALKSIVVKDINAVSISMFEAQSKEDLMGSIDQLFDKDSYSSFEEELLAIWERKSKYEGETVNRTLDGKRMIVQMLISFPEKREDFTGILVCMADITERKLAEAALRESENRYKSIFDSVPVSIWEEDFSKVVNFLNDLRENGIKDLDLYLRQHPQAVREAASLIIINEVNDATVSMFGAKSKADLLQFHERVFTQEGYDNFRRELLAIWNKLPNFYGETTNRTLDGREISTSISANIPADSEGYSRVFISVEDITERKKAEDQIRRQVKHLASLRAVDMAISASIDLPITLRVLINQAVQQLVVDAASILLFDPGTQRLKFAAGSGFVTHAIEDTNLKLGESYAGKAALERRIVAANDLATRYSQLLTENLSSEGFTDYIGVPLIAKGVVKGVLELFNRTPLPANAEWMSLLDSMAGQAAIAIDNATLFDEVQQANINLRRAYEATIEGWARALELRDGDTEGHSVRVADMTVHLAEMFNIKGDALVDIRRGALLHDIGKMGIPDHILLKEGPLSEAEWEIMRRHPVYGRRLLESIEFLQAAIDIPYSHHEKWDGSGYPQGLKAEEIPLAGRIFAVIDCWDALISDRPYRKAWSYADTWKYIESNAGKEYDPKVVEKFHELLVSLNMFK